MRRDLLLVCLLALFLVALPTHLRFASGNFVLAGDESYYHARMAQNVAAGVFVDDGVVVLRDYVVQPFHVVLAPFSGSPLLMVVVCAFFTFLSFVLFLLVLRRWFSPSVLLWSSVVFVLSPIFVGMGGVVSPYAFLLCLLLGGCLLLSRSWFGVLCFVLLALSGFIFVGLSLLFIWLLFLSDCIDGRRAGISAFIVGLIGLLSLPSVIEPVGIFGDIGAVFGISIFGLLLALVGACLVWYQKFRYYGVFALCSLLLVASFVHPVLLVFSNVVISVLAGIALAGIFSRRWEVKFLRSGSLILVFLTLLYGSISHSVVVSSLPPSQEFFDLLPESGVVFAPEQYGFWIEYANLTSVIDPLWRESDDGSVLFGDVQKVLYGQDVADTSRLLSKYGVSFVLITGEMSGGLVWDRDGEGLDFLTSHETFKKRKSSDFGVLWKVTYEK